MAIFAPGRPSLVRLLCSVLTRYHTALHGADVLVSCASIFASLPQFCVTSFGKEALRSAERDHERGGVGHPSKDIAPLHTFSLMFAALFHDFRHKGVPNRFLVMMHDPLALVYSDDTVLERMHAAETFKFARRWGAFRPLSKADYAMFRRLVVTIMMATDLANGMRSVVQVKSLFPTVFDDGSSGTNGGAGSSALAEEDRLPAVLSLVIECADLAHPAKPLLQHQIWSVLITEEFYAQGRLELARGLPLSPLCEPSRDAEAFCASQRGFIDYVVAPKLRTLATLCARTTMRSSKTRTDSAQESRGGDGGLERISGGSKRASSRRASFNSKGSERFEFKRSGNDADIIELANGSQERAAASPKLPWIVNLERNHAYWDHTRGGGVAENGTAATRTRSEPFTARVFDELATQAKSDGALLTRALAATRQSADALSLTATAENTGHGVCSRAEQATPCVNPQACSSLDRPSAYAVSSTGDDQSRLGSRVKSTTRSNHDDASSLLPTPSTAVASRSSPPLDLFNGIGRFVRGPSARGAVGNASPPSSPSTENSTNNHRGRQGEKNFDSCPV